MAVGEAPRLRLARLLFVYGEPGEAKLSTRAVIVFNRLVVYEASVAMGTDIVISARLPAGIGLRGHP